MFIFFFEEIKWKFQFCILKIVFVIISMLAFCLNDFKIWTKVSIRIKQILKEKLIFDLIILRKQIFRKYYLYKKKLLFIEEFTFLKDKKISI